MPTTAELLPNPRSERRFEKTWKFLVAGTDPDGLIRLGDFKVTGCALFAAGILEGATQVDDAYRGESNQEPPNDETN